MPHQDFDAARRAHAEKAGRVEDPITFGLDGHTFTVHPDPTLGDVFELHDAPDIDVEHFDGTDETHLALVRTLCRFIEHMLIVEDRSRWHQALYKIRTSEMGTVIGIADYLTREVVNRPTEPSTTSSDGQEKDGRQSRSESAGESDSS